MRLYSYFVHTMKYFSSLHIIVLSQCTVDIMISFKKGISPPPLCWYWRIHFRTGSVAPYFFIHPSLKRLLMQMCFAIGLVFYEYTKYVYERTSGQGVLKLEKICNFCSDTGLLPGVAAWRAIIL